MAGQRVVDFSEFRENLSAYLESGEVVVVMQEGRRVGTYIPVKTLPSVEIGLIGGKVTEIEVAKANWAKFEQSVARLDALVEEYGITEDEAIEEFERLRRESRNTDH